MMTMDYEHFIMVVVVWCSVLFLQFVLFGVGFVEGFFVCFWLWGWFVVLGFLTPLSIPSPTTG